MFWTYSGGFALCYTTALALQNSQHEAACSVSVQETRKHRTVGTKHPITAPVTDSPSVVLLHPTSSSSACVYNQSPCFPQTPILKPCFTSCSATHLFIHTIRGKYVTIKLNKSKIHFSCLHADRFPPGSQKCGEARKKTQIEEERNKKDALYVILNRFESDWPLL